MTRVAIYGAGAIGGYIGALLHRAGADVTLIARGPHLTAIRERGLRLDLGRNLLQPVKELEATLRAQVDVAQIKKRLFSASEPEAPTPYRHQVEEYYRELSRQPKER